MRLTDLEPEFIARAAEGDSFHWTGGIQDADGVMFLCPKCHGTDAAHLVVCWQPHVPLTVRPAPGRWEFRGRGLKDLTLRMGTSSVLLSAGCRAHFAIERGEVRML